MLLLKCKVTWSVSLIHCSVVLWHTWKLNWLALRRSLSSMCLWNFIGINFSKNLSVLDKRLIGRKFWGNFWFLSCFGTVLPRLWVMRQPKAVIKCTSDLVGRCLKHSFEIPSIPQAFLNFNEFINFCISQGLTFSKGVSSAASSSAWTLASTRRLRFSPQKSCGVNWFAK
jgi:hypothetical protein